MKFLVSVLVLLLPVTVWAAGDKVNPKIAAAIQAQIPDLQIDSVHKTPIAELYELDSRGKVYYADKSGRFLIVNGQIFDTSTRANLTAQRIEMINKIDWSKLPLDKAVVSGDEDGLEVAIFTDPDCPYCRKLEEELKGAKGIRVYTFMYPLTQLHPDAWNKAEAIMCSKDQHAMMSKVMLENFKPQKPKGCQAPLEEIQQLAQGLNIFGTPTMVARDGRKFAGVKSLDDLKAWLAAGQPTQ